MKCKSKMKKKVIFKKWIEYILLSIQFMLLLTLGAESDNFTIFALSKVIALLLFYMNHKIIVKYTRLYE